MNEPQRLLAGRHAIVTGGARGIGRAIAESLARHGAAVTLLGRDRVSLTETAVALGSGVAADVADVTDADAVRAAFARAVERAGPVTILINNAGFGQFRAFADVDAARDAELIALNVAAPVALAHAFVAAATATPRHYLLNVASMVAWQAIPNFATYGASKVFVRNFSESLHYELAPRGIGVTCLCPGGTRTEFHALAGAGDYGRLARAAMLDADPVAERGVRAMLAGTKTVVPGALNRLSCWLTGVLPRGLASRSATRVMGRPRAAPLPPRKPRDS